MDAELLTWAKRFYPAAVLWLGDRTEARYAVIEAAVAAKNNKQDVLAALFRICRLRAPEHPENTDIPEPLSTLLRLPPSSRRDYAFSLCDIPDEEIAAAKGITPEEQAQKTEKAMRQLMFLQGGVQPEQLRAALPQIAWADTDTAALENALAPAEQVPEPATPPIEHRKTGNTHGKTVAVPMWALVGLCFGVMLLGAAVAMYSLRRDTRPAPPVPEENDEFSDIQDISQLQSGYLSLAEIQEKAAQYIGKNADSLIFIQTRLRPDDNPAAYELIVQDSAGTRYEYRIDAVTGEVRSQKTNKAEKLLHTGNWLPAAAMRRTALEQAGLEAQDAIFLKEKLGTEGESGYYKYELADTEGRLYTIQLDAVTGILLGYKREDAPVPTPEKVISAEDACLAAVQSTGGTDPAQVLFTRAKLEGAVYFVAFTADDGTQYSVEIDAVTGDVCTAVSIPAPADMTGAVGVLAAYANACKKAGLGGDETPRCTKAKIDRGSGTYVYELEFETGRFGYEAAVLPETGEVVQLRAKAK